MRDYNRFINSVLENPLLRSNELVEQFLTKGQEEFHNIKQKYKKISKLVSMNEFHSLTGDFDVTFYNDQLHSPLYILQNIEKKRNILKDINLNLKNIINCMENLNKYLDILSKLFFNLENEYQTNDYKFNSLDNLGRLFKNFSDFYFEKKIFLDIQIREFFKYINMELKEIKNLCNDSKYAKINLEKCENALINFQNNNKNIEVYKYEIQKKQVEKKMAKRTCNFLRNRTYEEFQRIIGIHYIRIKNYFLKIMPIISELLKKENSFSVQIINCF